MDDLRNLLQIPQQRLDALNAVLLNPDMRIIDALLEVVQRYGDPASINRQAEDARQLPALLDQVQTTQPGHLADLEWLQEQQAAGAFIPMDGYRQGVLGARARDFAFDEKFAVTLEISAGQYFSWVRAMAERAIAQRCLMPGRVIRVRKMKEQEQDGDLPAMMAAMTIIGASVVETLDTKGTDGANVHLGGPDTITGYFGGVGQPNDYALKWVDEFLYYYTRYGVRQVLNVNPGTVLLGYLLHRLGIDIEFKISVFMGNDNPYAAFWTLLAAKLFARDDGTSPLIGFNWSNSVDNDTLALSDQFRAQLGFEEVVRFEHHITETWKHIVRQPYNRRAELVEIAPQVANISAKHEGGDPEIEQQRERPSDILDYFRDRTEIEESGDADAVLLNFLDKFDALNATAQALTERGIAVIAAQHLH
ncbi:MAG: hypothetical protein GYB65_15315 [Chloroflexi bacterium]|nr:hypothetical protein [Chloroflexota bacterium]